MLRKILTLIITAAVVTGCQIPSQNRPVYPNKNTVSEVSFVEVEKKPVYEGPTPYEIGYRAAEEQAYGFDSNCFVEGLNSQTRQLVILVSLRDRLLTKEATMAPERAVALAGEIIDLLLEHAEEDTFRCTQTRQVLKQLSGDQVQWGLRVKTAMLLVSKIRDNKRFDFKKALKSLEYSFFGYAE